MQGTITKIDSLKMSRNGDTPFFRIKIVLDNGRFAMTDVCPKYRNYANWEPVIERFKKNKSAAVDGLVFIPGDGKKVNADSPIKLLDRPITPPTTLDESLVQRYLLNKMSYKKGSDTVQLDNYLKTLNMHNLSVIERTKIQNELAWALNEFFKGK